MKAMSKRERTTSKQTTRTWNSHDMFKLRSIRSILSSRSQWKHLASRSTVNIATNLEVKSSRKTVKARHVSVKTYQPFSIRCSTSVSRNRPKNSLHRILPTRITNTKAWRRIRIGDKKKQTLNSEFKTRRPRTSGIFSAPNHLSNKIVLSPKIFTNTYRMELNLCQLNSVIVLLHFT